MYGTGISRKSTGSRVILVCPKIIFDQNEDPTRQQYSQKCHNIVSMEYWRVTCEMPIYLRSHAL